MKTIYLIPLLFFCCLCSSNVSAQLKIEKEKRIRSKDVPTNALAFIDSLQLTKCVRWYREESQDGISIEAKTKHKKNQHSIEFDSVGKIQDIEIEYQENEIDTLTMQTLHKYLSTTFESYNFRKIQKQYTDTQANLLDFLLRKKQHASLQERYELIVEVETNTSFKLLELLTDKVGNVINTYQIDTRNTDNLEY